MDNNMSKTKTLTTIALLTALSCIIMKFETPIPFFPPFLKIDLSSAVVLVGGLLYGPMYVFPIALVKGFVGLFMSSTGGVGQGADFLITAAFAGTVSLVYKKVRDIKGIMLGCALGTVAMAVVGALANMYILLPAFSLIMPFEKIWDTCRAVNPVIIDMKTYIIYAVVPFNIFKGVIISIISYLVYKLLTKIFRF